jgi:hypothetical protein
VIPVIIVDPDGEEYDAQIDETGTDEELRQEIILALGLDGSVDDYDVKLASGIKIDDGSVILVEKRRVPKVKIQPKSRVSNIKRR